MPKSPCKTCQGRGRVVQRQTVSVDVPAGIADGQRIRLSGRGHAGEHGGPPGDLYVLVRVKEDERFVRDGDDLVTVLDVAAPLAALGTTLDVPTLDGPVPLEIPAGAQPHEQLALRGKGMPALRRGRRGDLRVVVNVVIPRQALACAEGADAAARRLARRGEPALRRRRLLEAQAGLRRMIRLALRVAREDAEIALAQLLELAPSGVEEVDGGDWVEYAVYGSPGELPDLPDLRAAVGGALVEVTTSELPDDWSERWKDFHKPLVLGDRLAVRPPWEPSQGTAIELVIDPAQAFGTGSHATTRLCLELLLELADSSPTSAARRSMSAAARACSRSPPPSSAGSRSSRSTTTSSASTRRSRTRRSTTWSSTSAEATCATRRCRPRRPCSRTCCGRCCSSTPRTCPKPPRRLIASGLLVHEGDEIAAAFAEHGLRERARAERGEWCALLLAAD